MMDLIVTMRCNRASFFKLLFQTLNCCHDLFPQSMHIHTGGINIIILKVCSHGSVRVL